MFFSSWLHIRAKVLEKYCDLRDNEEVRNEILKGYRKVFDEGCDVFVLTPFLRQFLSEAIAINDFANPRRKKDIDVYYGYAYTHKIFSGTKEKFVSYLKDLKNEDIRKTFLSIHNKFSPLKMYM
jgi:hypothetical protein